LKKKKRTTNAPLGYKLQSYANLSVGENKKRNTLSVKRKETNSFFLLQETRKE
jgi:hypothetical protein